MLIGDHYQILEQLGQGGMGKTYLAIDTRAGNKRCLVKEFCPQTTNQSDWQKCSELFAREAAILAKIKHPQIPLFLDWIEEQDRLFLVQEYIEGQTYWQLLQQQENGFSEAGVKQWLKDVLPVIQFIHEQDVIHRDIAPDNIMCRSNDKQPILIDFGAVKEVIYGSQQSTISTTITKAGYSAPEQFRGKISRKSDIYSLGVTAVVLLTKKQPEELIDEETNEWQWQNHTNVSSNLAQILNKMLQQQPRYRYESAAEILRDLDQLKPILLLKTSSNQEQLYPTKISDRPIRPHPLRYGIAVTVALCLVMVTGGGTWLASPHISWLCQQLNNCAIDREFHLRYQQYQQLGEQAITAAQKSQTIQDLQVAQTQLKQVIADLITVPQDVKVFGQSQQTLERYRQQSQAIANRIVREQEAVKHLDQVKFLEVEAIKNTQAAKTIKQYQNAQAKWQNIEQQLQAIPVEVFISDHRKAALRNSQQQQQTIQSKINQLRAAAAKERERDRNKQRRSSKSATSTANKITPKKPSNSQIYRQNYPPQAKSTVTKTSPGIIKPWFNPNSPNKRRW